MHILETFEVADWSPNLDHQTLQKAVEALENGRVLYLPKLSFPVSEKEKFIFSSQLLKKDRKNISFDPNSGQLKGIEAGEEQYHMIMAMMRRFSDVAAHFVHQILPSYEDHLKLGRTSFRPVEIKGRESPSIRKDDTLLHLDSFPSTPTGGQRILRFFANVNPYNKPRVWKVGESYDKVLKRFLPRIKKPFPGSRQLLSRLGITKSFRILYDHYMLHIHNSMKSDAFYQKEVPQQIVEFPPFTCWLCFTDQVSHAALAGQYVFEQSFYLPIEGQKFPERSPLHYMEELFQKRLRN